MEKNLWRRNGADNVKRGDEKLTYNGFMEAFKNIKLRKGAGPDQISKEIIKYGGEKLTKGKFKLVLNIWKEKTMPRDTNV